MFEIIENSGFFFLNVLILGGVFWFIFLVSVRLNLYIYIYIYIYH